jgi:hypothetical protein
MRADAAVEADEAGGDWESWLMLLPWAASASRLADVSTPDAADGHDGDAPAGRLRCESPARVGTRSEMAHFNVERCAERVGYLVGGFEAWSLGARTRGCHDASIHP